MPGCFRVTQQFAINLEDQKMCAVLNAQMEDIPVRDVRPLDCCVSQTSAR